MPTIVRQRRRIGFWAAILCFIALMAAQPALAERPRPLSPDEFSEAAAQGFGDHDNTAAWSMQWWRGKLYVGTVRAWFCWSEAWFHSLIPLIPYPSRDPVFSDCAPDPMDLALQAEIWRFTPATKRWERVYRSPRDVEIPGHPGHYTSRDVGFRNMMVFTEPDGTEALYVVGVTSNALWPQMPPPRILRSTDGVTFKPIPQDRGTILGDLGQDNASFRAMAEYKGRLYVVNGQIRGQGSLLESANPKGGNDNFRWVTGQGVPVYEMGVFNGWLYLGIADGTGYSVVKTDATGEPPYRLIPVIEHAAYGRPHSSSVVSMEVFGGSLYVGTDEPTELVRINADDSWDLIVGKVRQTPSGPKYPLSGMDSGFDWPLNVHLWRMVEHQGVLYVGTNDQSTRWGAIPGLDTQLRSRYGFDLYASVDGVHFVPITVNGFGDKYQMGIRTFASTPVGLFFGTASYGQGLRVWKGTAERSWTVFLPITYGERAVPR